MTCSVATPILSVANQKFSDIGLTFSATDDQDPAPRVFVQVYSNEDDDETGNGNFSPDARIVPPQVLLRAERSAQEEGRVYIILLTAVDSAGNSAQTFSTVLVPRDGSNTSLARVRQLADQISSASLPPPGYALVGDGADRSRFQVSITSPAESASFAWGSPITLSATTTFDAAKVEYYDGFTKVGEATAAPYAVALAGSGPGLHVIEAVAIDGNGDRYSSNPVTFVQHPNLPPSVQINLPGPNSIYQPGESIEISAEASDADGAIAKVEFFANEAKLGERSTPPYSVVWNGATPGGYTLTVVATDTAGARTASAGQSLMVNAPPSVALLSPASGAVFATGQTIALTADAADLDGLVAKVEFYSGQNKIAESTASPFTGSWSGASAGNHSLFAVATDRDGGTAVSAHVNIQVQNPPPVPTPTPTPTPAPSPTPSSTPLPVTPADLYATRVSPAELTLSWTDLSAGTSSFRIQRSSNGGQSWAVIGLVGPGVTSFTDPASPEASFFLYEVIAFNSRGSAAPSNQTSSAGTDPNIADTDLDGVVDQQEAQRGLNPHNPDSDGDGARDGEDILARDARFALRRLPVARYAVIPIDPGPIFSNSETVRINNLGSVIRSTEFEPLYSYVGGSAQSWFYKDGTKTFIPALNDQSGVVPGPYDRSRFYCRITGINDLDQIVGTSSYSYDPSLNARYEEWSGPGHAVIGGGGALTDLGDLTVDNGINDSTGETTIDGTNLGRSDGIAINNNGTVLGGADTYVDVDPPSVSQTDYSIVRSGEPRAALWSGGSGAVVSVGGAYAFNDRGEIVGIGYAPDTPYMRAGYWRDGIAQVLPSIRQQSESIAYDISQAGYVLGTEYKDQYTQATDAFPFIWRDGLMQPLGRRTPFAEAKAINNKGQAVGVGSGFGTYAGFLWQNFEAFNLNGRIDSASGWGIGTAYDINDSGVIVAMTGRPGDAEASLSLLVPVRFEVQEGKINQGYDPLPEASGQLPWASVVKGSKNSVVKLVVPYGAEKIELAVVQDQSEESSEPDEGPIEVSVEPANGFKNGDNNLTLTGMNGPNATNAISTVTIEARLYDADGTYQVCGKLRVMALPPRVVSLGIYRIADPGSPDQAVGGPTDKQIKDTLNDIYRQAGIQFEIVGSSSPSETHPGTINVAYDSYASPNVAAGDGRVQEEEYRVIQTDPRTQLGKARLFLAANSGIANDDTLPLVQRRYSRGDKEEGERYCFVFTRTGHNNDTIVMLNAAHEIGHILDLTGIPSPYRGQHDPGPFPLETAPAYGGLMHPGQGTDQPGLWIRREDWKRANETARTFNP